MSWSDRYRIFLHYKACTPLQRNKNPSNYLRQRNYKGTQYRTRLFSLRMQLMSLHV